MREITAKQAARAAGGRVIFGDPEKKICHISLDSRKMEGRDLFVPIVGERVDAHRFICQAISAGAETVFTSCHHSEKEVREAIESQCREHPEWSGQALLSTWICVESTKAALQALGAWCRSQAQIPLVGITGSVGKTTTREMVACALSAGYRVYKTPGNSNSQVGVPITVFNIPKEAQIGVIELGMSEPGEMTKIAQVAQTDCAVMTNIGVAHIEQLGSKENILKEKLHIQDGMAEDGVLFLNGDDPLLRAVMPDQGRSRILYGLWEGCDCRGENLHLENGFPVFTAVCKEERVQVHLKVMGNHMVSNALAALAVASRYGIPLQKAAAALEQFDGFKGRQQIIKEKGVTIIDDSYNASPVSMKAGIEVLSSMAGVKRRIAVLADMKELGPDTITYHREVGAFLKHQPIDQLVLMGELAWEIETGLKMDGGKISCVKTSTLEETETWLAEAVREGDCLLFKGSNSMGLSKAVSFMREKLTN